MRILIPTGIYPPDIGGPATYSSLLVRELTARGHFVDVVTYGPAGVSREIPKGIRHIIYFFKCLAKGWRVDVFFAQDGMGAGLPALVAAKIVRKKFILRVPGDYVWEQSQQRFGIKEGILEFQQRSYGWRIEWLRALQKFVASSADQVVTPSKFFRELVAGWLKDPDRVQHIYNGIQIVDEGVPDDVLPYDKREKVIMTAGRLVPWKGFFKLIEMMKDLPDWKLVIVGEGPDHEALLAGCAKHGVEDRVSLTGSVSRDELLDDYLRKARVFVLNTSFESFSFQIVEAMYSGLPVITTDVCNLSEMITHDEEGILVKVDDISSIEAAIHHIDDDASFRDKLITNARKKATRFSLNNMLDELTTLLELR